MVFQVLILLATDLRETFEKVPEGGDLIVLRSFGRRSLNSSSETSNRTVKSPYCPDPHMFRHRSPSAVVPDLAESAPKAPQIKPTRRHAQLDGTLAPRAR